MTTLGFAMVATATAGTIVHAYGRTADRILPITALAARTSPTGPADRTGFYDSLTQPAKR